MFHLQSCVTTCEVPDLMTTGQTILLLKDKRKRNEHLRPITCSTLMWKSHTGIVADEIYNNLGDTDLLLDNQKGCYRNSIGTKNLWLIDKVVVKNFTRRMVGLSMVWIDYQKVYGMVHHSWIRKSMEMCGFMENILSFV